MELSFPLAKVHFHHADDSLNMGDISTTHSITIK